MREFTINDLIDILLDNVKIIAVVTVLFILIAVIYTTTIITPIYESSTKIILVKTKDENVNVTNYEMPELTTNDIMLNQKLISTYGEIMKSNKVISQVVNNLNLDETIADVSKSITVSPVKDSEVINIDVKNKNPEIAANIANELVKIFVEEVKTIYKIENVVVVDYASVKDNPINVSIMKNAIIFMMVGMLLSYGVFFLKEYLDTTLKSGDDLEKGLDINIIGVLPDEQLMAKYRREH